MKVRWTAQGGYMAKEAELMRKFELCQIKKQIEILSTFLPDAILNMPMAALDTVQHFVGVLLFADVSGFTPLCEKYNKTGKGGIYRLTATLNAYIGALVEVIYFYGGDVLKFSGDAFLALWRVEVDANLFQVIHEVIVCALFIQQTLGCFETEVNVLLKVKLAISCGNMTFSVIGDASNRHYVLLGSAINDVKAAEHASVSGDVVIAPTAWGHIPEESYEVTYTVGGNVKVWRCLYKPNEMAKKDKYDKKDIQVQKLCDIHIKHREVLHSKKKFDDTQTDSKIIESFVSSLPPRVAITAAPYKCIANDIRPFIIRPVQEQVDERQPLQYLTEMREVTIQFINIVPTTYYEPKLVIMIDTAYQIICNIVFKLLGVVNKVSTFDKDIMILVLFGLRGVKHELESQNALKSGHKIRKALSRLEGVESVSVGLTNGLVYCGVVGHPLRREYTVIGGSVNKAARIMCAYQYKVTCDYTTYKHSKLSSYYFQLQSEVKLKGIEDAGHIFEFNEDFEEQLQYDVKNFPIVGRNDEINLGLTIINNPEDADNYYGLCFYGQEKLGKTRLVQTLFLLAQKQGHAVASMNLWGHSMRPYYCVSVLYKQLYDEMARLDSKKGNVICSLPPDLWNLNEILQQNAVDKRRPGVFEKQNKIIEWFKEIARGSARGIACLFVDNVQHMDKQSLAVILASLTDQHLRIICAGHFEEDVWDIQWKLSLCEDIKLLQLEPLPSHYIPIIACQMFDVKGINKRLSNLLVKGCEGRPGWLQSSILGLVNYGAIKIRLIFPEARDLKTFFYPDPNLVTANENDSLEPDNRAILIADLANKMFEQNQNLAAVSLDLFDSFTPYQQLVIKTGAALGEVFSRSLLFVVLKYPNEHTLSDAIKNLFEEEVFECGTQYVHADGLVSNKLVCRCYMDEDDYPSGSQRNALLPKYAYCKNFHFKNKTLRAVAYELLPANQRKELHLRVTDVLEHQNNLCPNCLRDNSSAIIVLRTFAEVMHHCNFPDRPLAKDNAGSDIYHPLNLKQVIRDGIRANLVVDTELGSKIAHRRPSCKPNPIPKRKIWDPSTCFCLEILTRVYADLVYHSDRGNHVGKKIFFLMQYAVILLTMNEFQDALPPLAEASELCMIDAKYASSIMNENFRRIHLGKVHRLLADINFSLGNLHAAKQHILISLRQYNVPMMCFTYKIPNRFLVRGIFSRGEVGRVRIPRKKNLMLAYDYGIAMNVVSNMFAAEGHWELAKLAAARSICLIRQVNANIPVLCDVYSTAIDLYSFFGDFHTCERLERCVNAEILRNYAENITIGLFTLSKLIATIFQTRVMSGQISKAIRLGYRAMDLNYRIQAYYVQMEIIPILATTLLLAQRIQDAVEVSKILYTIGKNIDQSALLAFYAFCVELKVDTSFTLEPIEKCDDFASKYFENSPDKTDFTNAENKICIYLHVYYLRIGRWAAATKWSKMIHIEQCKFINIPSIINLIKYTESLLLMLDRNMDMKKNFADLQQKQAVSFLKKLETVAKKWKIFLPRYYHYMAYYNKLRKKKRPVKRFIRLALATADKQENILEHCWINQSTNVWSGGYTFKGETAHIDWKLATTYNKLQWTQILYGLPCDS